MSQYLKNAGPTLMGLMQRAHEMAATRATLVEEIDLARALLVKAVDTWNLALEAKTSSDETRYACECVVKELLDLVSRTAYTAARTKALDAGSMQMATVGWVVAEVTRSIEEVVRDASPTLADQLVERIGQIKVPEDGLVSKFMQKQRDEQFL